jgi:hypothetical protein
LTHRETNLTRRTGAALLLIIATLAVTVPTAPASAQGLFDVFFGNSARRAYTPPSASSYADPYPQHSPFGRPAEPRRSESGPSGGGSLAYCVRLCDGRHFPMQRLAGTTPAQTCSSFCPAAKTKVFSGSAIDRAVASDGSRYSDLSTAFVYRDRFVADCTCNGKDPVGLVTTNAMEDPTLRQGDIVATNSGLVAYTGSGRNSGFTPLESYAGIGSELRGRLAGVKIVPQNASAVPDDLRKSPSLASDRRVQLDR